MSVRWTAHEQWLLTRTCEEGDRQAREELRPEAAPARPPARPQVPARARAARGPRAGRKPRAGEGDRPLRPRPRRVPLLRGAHDNRRAEALLPRHRLGGAPRAQPAGAGAPGDADAGEAERRAGPVADAVRACVALRAVGRGGARGAGRRAVIPGAVTGRAREQRGARHGRRSSGRRGGGPALPARRGPRAGRAGPARPARARAADPRTALRRGAEQAESRTGSGSPRCTSRG